MAKEQVLGLCRDEQVAAQAVEALEKGGFSADEYEILTGVPYPEGTFGEKPARHRLFIFPLIGAAAGLAAASLLAMGTQLSYPLVTGGKPILALPPMVIIMFEGTMLGAILFTVIGVIFESRLFGPRIGLYDRRITEGYIGLMVSAAPERVARAEEVMAAAGVEDFKHPPLRKGKG